MPPHLRNRDAGSAYGVPGLTPVGGATSAKATTADCSSAQTQTVGKLHQYELPQRGTGRAQANSAASNKPASANVAADDAEGSGVEEMRKVEKRLRNVTGNLKKIETLKREQAAGKQLEQNQVAKIRNEDNVRKELRELEDKLRQLRAA